MEHFTAVVDYGVGNLRSIENAMDYLGLKCRITDDPGVLERADRIILPGVGAFPDAAKRLRESGLAEKVRSAAQTKPLLGICLGMQLLFDWGEEGVRCEGLHLVEGSVERIETAFKLPHIGWNQLEFPRESPLFSGLVPDSSVYFVHSYRALPADRADILATTDYGTEIVAAVGRGNVFGCQFHPEKSGEVGLQILRNFGALNQ